MKSASAVRAQAERGLARYARGEVMTRRVNGARTVRVLVMKPVCAAKAPATWSAFAAKAAATRSALTAKDRAMKNVPPVMESAVYRIRETKKTSEV